MAGGLSEVVSEYLDKGLVLVIADLLSLITVSSCLVIKVPQINTIRENQSSKGISVLGLCLELFSYTVMISYNYTSDYDFLSYMEYPVLLLQEYILIYYAFKYQNLLGKKTQIFAVAYVIIATLIYLKLFPIIILTFLVPFCTPIGATSKVLQLLAILRTKDASSVSRTTWALSAFTNMTRIYTVYVQSHDLMLLSNFLISTFLSASVFAAACFYKKKVKKA
ncbi:solute carrier family 66 member 3 [Drosophila guanche]|uniref:Solute carrier family 66 member 3 n=1 Tax=Drosophila guanche TaxID=7266 RepID=A0A3B0K0I2_DROGU|nr:solute carrier family 66 member 3 [Drosophila guanche]XP_034658981.1 solute carrier family 66 member 3 [Drosophila subobscura]SPP76868.1 blast:PQ-loop repeat-containing protein 3 [Drosophila guanche]